MRMSTQALNSPQPDRSGSDYNVGELGSNHSAKGDGNAVRFGLRPLEIQEWQARRAS